MELRFHGDLVSSRRKIQYLIGFLRFVYCVLYGVSVLPYSVTFGAARFDINMSCYSQNFIQRQVGFLVHNVIGIDIIVEKKLFYFFGIDSHVFIS